MAVILQMTYSKKLGLPNYSSHQCSVSVQSEIADLTQITGECKKLYALLQDSVDREIQAVGFLPDATRYGMNGGGAHPRAETPNGRDTDNGAWQCSDKQRELIEKIVRENQLDKNAVEQIAQDMFGKGVKALNKLDASGLIDELIERHGGRRNGGGRRDRRFRPLPEGAR